MEIEIKTLKTKLADIDNKKRIVKAYYSAFGNVDNDGDIIVKGAGRKTIKENGPQGKNIIKHFLNHEFQTNPGALPLGKVLELGEDNHGNFFVSKIARTKQANDIYAMYEDDMIDNHSFGFAIVKHRIIEGIRHILEYKMLEVSTVTLWASNFNTPTIDVKENNAAANLGTANNTTDFYNSLYLVEPSNQTLDQKADMLELCKLIDTNLFI